MTQGSNGEGEQTWGPQDHLGGSSHTSPGADDGLWSANPCTIITGKARWTDPQAYRGFCLSPCWRRIQDERWADKEFQNFVGFKKYFPDPTFFPSKNTPFHMHGTLPFSKLSSDHISPLILLRREARLAFYPHSEDEAIDNSHLPKWDKLVVDLGPDHRLLKCEEHDTWSDKSALDPVPTTSRLSDPRQII